MPSGARVVAASSRRFSSWLSPCRLRPARVAAPASRIKNFGRADVHLRGAEGQAEADASERDGRRHRPDRRDRVGARTRRRPRTSCEKLGSRFGIITGFAGRDPGEGPREAASGSRASSSPRTLRFGPRPLPFGASTTAPSSSQLWTHESGVNKLWSSAKPATIAIVDSGIDASRQDFAGRVKAQVSFVTSRVSERGRGRSRARHVRRGHRGGLGRRATPALHRTPTSSRSTSWTTVAPARRAT